VQCSLLVPVRSFSQAKTRLDPILSESERESAMRDYVANVVRAAKNTQEITDIFLISSDNDVALAAHEYSVHFFDSELSLNAVVRDCAPNVENDGIIVAHGDLPLIENFDDICTSLEDFDVVLAPDRHRSGTNVLAHRSTIDFTYSFGDHSLRSHEHQCIQHGYCYLLIQSVHYGLDIDTKDDFALLQKIKRQ